MMGFISKELMLVLLLFFRLIVIYTARLKV